MGLGKTLQIIAFILSQGKNAGIPLIFSSSYVPAFQLAGGDQQICPFTKSSTPLWATGKNNYPSVRL
jgi:hypothetical protein